MLRFTCTKEQKKQLEGLAYWIADASYIKERFGYDEPELKVCRDTLEKSIFPELDKLNVPFWVQNAVMAWAENWRKYKSEHMIDALAKKGIYF